MNDTMKKASLILNIILVAAVVLLYVDRFANTGKKTKTEKTNNTETSANKYPEIVYVNMDSLVSGYDLYNVLSLELMQKKQNFETQLNSKMLSYQNRTMKLQSDYEKHVITSANYQKKAESMMNEQQQISAWQEKKSTEISEDEQNMTLRILDSIINVVKKYNKDNKHKLVLNNSFGGVLLYGDTNLNITDTILNTLNANTKQEELLAPKENEAE